MRIQTASTLTGMLLLGLANFAAAATLELTLAGFPVDPVILKAFSFDVLNYNPGAGHTPPSVAEFNITRTSDPASPYLFTAAALGTLFPSGALSFVVNDGGTEIKHLQIAFQYLQIASFNNISGGSSLPEEKVSFVFSAMTLSYDVQQASGLTVTALHPWNLLLPLDLPVGSNGPYTLPVNMTLDSLLARTVDGAVLSTLGDDLPGTLAGASPVPEPAAGGLLGLGLIGFLLTRRLGVRNTGAHTAHQAQPTYPDVHRPQRPDRDSPPRH